MPLVNFAGRDTSFCSLVITRLKSKEHMIHSVHVLFLPEHPSCLASYLPLNGSFLGQWGIVSGFEVSVQDVSMAAVPPSAPFRCEFFFPGFSDQGQAPSVGMAT